MKRVSILCGHYGSGKTNIAVNLAFMLKKEHEKVVVADLDIVNPYFRTKDSEKELNAAGIKLICSEFANSNADLPAMPQELYALVDDKSYYAVMDIGGDDRGACALGRYAGAIQNENDYEYYFVINCYRPLTATPEKTAAVMLEIERAGGLKFTSIINNSNLACDTSAEDVLQSLSYAQSVSSLTNLPIAFTSAEISLCDELSGKIPNLLPLKLQKKIR